MPISLLGLVLGLLIPQQPIVERPIKLGAPVAVAEGITLTIAFGSARSREAFASAGMKGLVLDLQFDAKSYATFRLEPSSDSAKSGVALETSGQRVGGPVALTNYLADKPDGPKITRIAELTPMPKTGRGYFSWVAFTGRGVVSVLFEAPFQPGATVLLLDFELGDNFHRLRVSL